MIYLLDTSTISALMRELPSAVSRLERLSAPDNAAIRSVARGEVLYGIRRLPDGHKRKTLDRKAVALFRAVYCYPISSDIADSYADLKADFESRGIGVSDNDLWIAATAISLSATLVSSDTDFSKVDGLVLEDWTK